MFPSVLLRGIHTVNIVIGPVRNHLLNLMSVPESDPVSYEWALPIKRSFHLSTTSMGNLKLEGLYAMLACLDVNVVRAVSGRSTIILPFNHVPFMGTAMEVK
jgi:hypothetical protein